MPFASLGLDASILKAVADQGYTEPTPIQKAAIPAVIEGIDVIGIAQTGTGKTAAFTLPLLTRLLRTANNTHKGRVRCLILVPSYTGWPMPRVMLHAHKLTLTHPQTGKPLTITVEPPKDFLDLKEWLAKKFGRKPYLLPA